MDSTFAELRVSALGGVVHEGEPHPIYIQPLSLLRETMRIQQTATEIKLVWSEEEQVVWEHNPAIAVPLAISCKSLMQKGI